MLHLAEGRRRDGRGPRRFWAVTHAVAGYVTACAVTPDGQHVVSASYDYTLKVWDLATYTCRITHRGDVAYAAVAVIATTVVAGDAAGVVWFLDEPPYFVGSSGIQERRMTPEELLSRLSRLLPSQFEEVLYRAQIPLQYLPGAPRRHGCSDRARGGRDALRRAAAPARPAGWDRSAGHRWRGWAGPPVSRPRFCSGGCAWFRHRAARPRVGPPRRAQPTALGPPSGQARSAVARGAHRWFMHTDRRGRGSGGCCGAENARGSAEAKRVRGGTPSVAAARRPRGHHSARRVWLARKVFRRCPPLRSHL